jgi:hypothetical protein
MKKNPIHHPVIILKAIALLLFLLTITAHAAIPQKINYQGYLTDPQGTAIDGNVSMVFAIYSQISGGTALWTETQTVTATDGVFSVNLGSVNSIDLPFDTPYYLGITVGSDNEMTPRQALTSVGYAFRAKEADRVKENAVTTEVIANDAVTTDKVADDAISGDKIAPATITSTNIANGAVGASQIGDGSIATEDLANDAVTAAKIKPAVISSIDGVSNDGGNVDLVAGSNVTITPDDAANTITIGSTAAGSSPWTESGGNVYRSSGRVGIGTSNPSYNLDVNGAINSTGEYRLNGKTALKIENNSIFIGDLAGSFNTTGNYNTFIGRGAGSSNTEGSKNNFIGDYAGSSNTTGSYNTFIGDNAGRFNTTGSSNTFLGNSAGFPNTIGSSNTFIGDSAGSSNTSGDSNTFLGRSSGFLNTEGNSNTFLGGYTGANNTTGSSNTFIGLSSGASNTTGSCNNFLGQEAGFSNKEGAFNTFVGRSAGHSNTSGSRNVFLGYEAGYNETGSDKLYIANGKDNSSVLIYGDFSTKKVGIGTTSPGYTLELSGCSGGNCAGKPDGASWATSSDIRLKDIHDDYEYGLTEISLITPVRFSYKEDNKLALPSGEELVGLIAQEVQEVIPDAVTEDDNGYLRLNADPVLWAMLNAIKELTSQVQHLKKKVKELEGGKK